MRQIPIRLSVAELGPYYTGALAVEPVSASGHRRAALGRTTDSGPVKLPRGMVRGIEDCVFL